MIAAAVSTGPIDLGALVADATADGAGAVATFSGIVRADDGVTALELEHYPGMTEAAMRALAGEVAARWALSSVRIVHRIGRMAPGETVVAVVAAAPHRQPALDACAFLIDALKTEIPFWKREWRGDAGQWVETRESDNHAMTRWRQP